MAREGVRTPIEGGIVQRLVQGVTGGVRYAITGQKPDWFGPNEPMTPVAPPETAGRKFDFPIGYNLSQKPRYQEAISFEQLRALADNHDLVRLAIETRKDQMGKLPFHILPKADPGTAKRAKPDDRCAMLQQFFQKPDRVHSWSTWLRLALEDLFVLDAPTLYKRRTQGGELYSLDPVDGATIKVLIDQDGRRPTAPLPAFQQVLKGLPAVDYTADELIYKPRNPRTNKVYGFSPVEQIIAIINIGLMRQVQKLATYTVGNVPEALIGVPEGWTPDQIAEFQAYWDTMLEGDLEARRKAKFVPGGLAIQFTRDPMLKDEYDEWIARVVMYCFSLPPLPFVREQNRATAMTAQDAARDEGLAPLMLWVKELIDDIIRDDFGFDDLEFTWQDKPWVDPATKSAINSNYVRAGIMSLDDARQDIGLEPLGIPTIIFGVGPMGFMYVEDLKRPDIREATIAPLLAQVEQIQQEAAMRSQQMLLGAPGDSPEGMAGDPLEGLPPEQLAALGLDVPETEPVEVEYAELDPETQEAMSMGETEDKRPLARPRLSPTLRRVLGLPPEKEEAPLQEENVGRGN